MFRLALRRILPKEMRVVCEFCRTFSTDFAPLLSVTATAE